MSTLRPTDQSTPLEAVTREPQVARWVVAVFVLFFTRALLFSTWVSRGPEVRRLLDIDTMQLGLVTMLVPLGGLGAIGLARALVHRLGSRAVAAGGYTLASAALAFAGPAITAGNVPLACVLLVVFGAPLAVVDFVGNHEGTMVDKAARRSVFAAIHGAFGLGMLSAAWLTGWASDAGVSLSTHFAVIGAAAFVASLVACLRLPHHPRQPATESTGTSVAAPHRSAWLEPRSQLIALIGFSFIMAETSAGTWVPLALTETGFTESRAAYALSLFWVAVTIGRLFGGLLVDAIGRFRAVVVSCVVTSAGLLLFMFAGAAWASYLGLAVWGLGMAVGFPMSVAAMGDDPARAAQRINMIVTVVYLSNICVGPALGAVGQAAGVHAAFAIPLALLLVSAGVARVTKPLAMPATR